MKNNLVISPLDNFLKKNNVFNNIFADRYTYDQCKTKKSTDQFLIGRLDLDYRTKIITLSKFSFTIFFQIFKWEREHPTSPNFKLLLSYGVKKSLLTL